MRNRRDESNAMHERVEPTHVCMKCDLTRSDVRGWRHDHLNKHVRNRAGRAMNWLGVDLP
jgi:hypothetical protein